MKRKTHNSKCRLWMCLLPLPLLAGCGNTSNPYAGEYAYIHDPETVILSLKDNGKAQYKGDKYRYTMDDQYITLQNGDDELKLRYTADDDEFYLYETAQYTYADEGAPNGFLGDWYDPDTNWRFEFESDGTFREDGYFPGTYIADAEAGTIKLCYTDHFYDTTIYYSVDGDVLSVEYPWSMVKAQ